jgi:hypothetical protein
MVPIDVVPPAFEHGHLLVAELRLAMLVWALDARVLMGADAVARHRRGGVAERQKVKPFSTGWAGWFEEWWRGTSNSPK